jgi:uncharacterized protein
MQTPRPALIVSIHDVSPLTASRVRVILEDLAQVGVERTSLLVIPNHHEKAPLKEDPACGAWLRGCAAEGHEIVLHGYYHRRAAREAGVVATLITEHYTAGEGEFFDLTRAEAMERLKRGKEDLAGAGLQSVGFIAPAWLLGQEAEDAVRQEGFTYTTRLANIKDLASGREIPTQSLVWSVRAGWRRSMSLGWNAFLNSRLTMNPILRIGIHPPDWDYPAIRRQILKLATAALVAREAMTYEECLQSA